MSETAGREPDPVIIECAINGVTSPEKNPHVPRKPTEIADDTFRALDAGASIIHAHNSEIALAGEEAARDYCAAWVPIWEEQRSKSAKPRVSTF